MRKWEDAGAVIVGKLNMHELGLGTTSVIDLAFSLHFLIVQIQQIITLRRERPLTLTILTITLEDRQEARLTLWLLAYSL